MSCPFRDNSYACTSHLQDREIRAVSPDWEAARGALPWEEEEEEGGTYGGGKPPLLSAGL